MWFQRGEQTLGTNALYARMGMQPLCKKKKNETHVRHLKLQKPKFHPSLSVEILQKKDAIAALKLRGSELFGFFLQLLIS